MDNSGSAVMPLDEPGCPIAILRAVWAVIVPPFNCQTVRPRAHIRNEVLEALGAAPQLANRDTSAAIILIGFVVLIAATAVHSLPNPINRGLGFPMRAAGLLHWFRLLTAATLAPSRSQGIRHDFLEVSTIALAPPRRFFPAAGSRFNDCEKPETLAGMICFRWHSPILTVTPN